jgi:hypothetical protein
MTNTDDPWGIPPLTLMKQICLYCEGGSMWLVGYNKERYERGNFCWDDAMKEWAAPLVTLVEISKVLRHIHVGLVCTHVKCESDYTHMLDVSRVVLIYVTAPRLKAIEQCRPNFIVSYPVTGKKHDLKASKQETEPKLCHRNSIWNCHVEKSSSR